MGMLHLKGEFARAKDFFASNASTTPQFSTHLDVEILTLSQIDSPE
jgi:hypothetical protein